MITKRIAVLFLILSCLFGTMAFAAEQPASGESHAAEEGHGETIWQGLGKWVNFAALAGILYYFLFRTLNVKDRFKEDYHQIQRSIESARQAKEEAERRLAELDQRMARLGQEIAELKADAAREADEEKNRILESAKREAERLLELAHKEIDNEVESARQMLRRQVAELAVQEGHEIIRKEIDEKDQKRLIRDYIEGFRK
ncbi:MAG TPA: F0F1 ATP synthase subunit B [Acidobacteriota bacterium]|nr:F0F1 ATP synthase subunit B [Acidobacteriota bacterium]